MLSLVEEVALPSSLVCLSLSCTVGEYSDALMSDGNHDARWASEIESGVAGSMSFLLGFMDGLSLEGLV